MLLGLMAAAYATAADDVQETALAATGARGGSVRYQSIGPGVRCTITSPEGIGRVTLKRRGTAWPTPLILRLELKGLESLTLTAGGQRLEVSLTSNQPHRLLVQHTEDQSDGSDAKPQPVAADSPLWPKFQVLDAAGSDVGLRLPPEGGCIEVTVPPRLLQDAQTLDIGWIDFHRG